MHKYFSTIFLLLFSVVIFGQTKYSISGTVVDKKSNSALPFVNIFLEGTTIGTQTDIDGKFTLTKVPVGKYQFVASMVGYLPYVQSLADISNNFSVNISLSEDVRYLSEVKVSAGRDKTWEKQMKVFEKEFLGSDFNKKLVKILNREVVEFDAEKGKLMATTNQPLIIKNELLGYKYTYILQNFEKSKTRIAYKGLGRFEFLDSSNTKQTKKYKKNRERAYEGSLKHFLKAVLNGNMEELGYSGNYINTEISQNKTKAFQRLGIRELETNHQTQYPFIAKDAIFLTDMPDNYLLILDCPLSIIYKKDYQFKYSQIIQLGNILVNKNGDLQDPYTVSITGDMSMSRIAKTLPFDYEIQVEEITQPNRIDISFLPQVLKNSVRYSREKVEISGLETHYLAGETIELEAFVKDLSTQTGSQISKTLYVDLIDLNKGKLLEHKILRLKNSQANLKFRFENNLPTGNFQIRAYTNWMRNFSENAFFSMSTTVFSQNYEQEFAKANENIKLDTAKIHIEGFGLVEGLRSKILLETINNLGEKFSQKFQLVANENQILIEGETDSTGVALFQLEPRPIESYHLVVNSKKYDLPKARPNGTIFTIGNIANGEQLKIYIQNKNADNQADTLTLAIIQEGEVVYWKSFLNNKSTLLITAPKANLSGNYTVFLVDSQSKTIAERHIQIPDNNGNTSAKITDLDFMNLKSTDFFEVNRHLPFLDEKGITIKGSIVPVEGKPNKKPLRLNMLLSSPLTDSILYASQSYFLETTNEFSFNDIEFFGKKEASFFVEKNVVNLDTTLSIPAIYAERLPINWYLLKNKTNWENLAKLNAELQELTIKTPLDSTENFENTENLILDENVIEGIVPNWVLYTKDFDRMSSIKQILSEMIKGQEPQFSKILVYLENHMLNNEEVKNINELINLSNIEKIIIFGKNIPTAYRAGNDCSIVLKLRRNVTQVNNKKFVILSGYDN